MIKNSKDINNIIIIIAQLLRINKPIPYILLFLTALYGLILASNNLDIILHWTPIFLLGSICIRSAGCIINDIWDKDFDNQVTRTKTRPITSNKIEIRTALSIFLLLLSISFYILLKLNFISIIIGIIGAILTCIYPLMKRYTHYPQVILGITFNLGVLISYATVKSYLNINIFILYLSCIFWTIAYDTVYGFMDIKDDIKIGIKSLAIICNRSNNPNLVIAIIQVLYISLFYLAFLLENFLNYSTTKITILITAYIAILYISIKQLLKLNLKSPNECSKYFTNQAILGSINALIILLLTMMN